jgi:hypothetical protein
MICAAVRKKGSHDQCPSKALFGHTLCGRHAKAKKVTLWKDVHKHKHMSIVNVQSLIRGWLVRNRLNLAGPGVLRRGLVTNEDDLVTCRGKQDVHPYEYFAFTENGKVWWFEFTSLWHWTTRSHIPTNPYTRTPLEVDTLKRLHEMWICHWRAKTSPIEAVDPTERIRNRWNVISQVFANYGFGNIHPNHFADLTKQQYLLIVRMILEDLQVAMPDTSNRGMLIRYLRSLHERYKLPSHKVPTYALNCSFLFMALLLRLKDPYIFAFTMLSALYRV